MPKRGKLKNQKYEESVVRNTKNLIERKEKYVGLKLSVAKQRIGVRQDDTRFDDIISEVIKEPKKKKKKDDEEGK